MKHIFILFVLFILPTSVLAQEIKNGIGKVIDAETKRPIESVAIYTPSTITISNTDGEYELNYIENENTTFSHINYYPYEIQLQNSPSIIELKPRAYALAEIVILAPKAVINELKEVWKKYDDLLKNKKDDTFEQAAFYYRQLIFVDDACSEYIESYFTSPISVKITGLALQEGRYAKIKKKSIPNFTNFFAISHITPFSTAEGKNNNPNPFLCADFEKYYETKILRIISPGQVDEIKVYEFTPVESGGTNKTHQSGYLYIRSSDQAIVRMEAQLKGISGSPDKLAVIQDDNYYITVTYKDTNGLYPVVEFVQVNADIVSVHKFKKKDKVVINAKSILFAVENTFDEQGNKLKQSDALLKKVAKTKYDQAFWDSHPVVKRTEVEQQVLDDFNRQKYFGTMKIK
jgi:hypothetical protein